MPLLPYTEFGAGLTLDRFNNRRTLLQQMDDKLRKAEAENSLGNYDRIQQRAFNLLTSSRLKSAFDLSREDPRLLDRYGRTLFGNCALIARKLIEEGVRFVNVTWDLFERPVLIDYDAWDTHNKNFSILKENKLPGLDQTFAALMQDLTERNLLDETLVVVMSEMGRTPKVNANAGRDHWTHCYSVLFAGAGIKGGSIYGASDAHAAYVKDKPISTGDICATIYRCLGIDPDSTVPDRSGRPVSICRNGNAIERYSRIVRTTPAIRSVVAPLPMELVDVFCLRTGKFPIQPAMVGRFIDNLFAGVNLRIRLAPLRVQQFEC